MILAFITVAIMNILIFKILDKAFYSDYNWTDFLLQISSSFMGSMLIVIFISCIVSEIAEMESRLVCTKELVPYKNGKYIEENLDDEIYYHYKTKDGKEYLQELTDQMFISYKVKDKPIVERYIYEYKNPILKYLFFNCENDKYVFYVPKNGIKKYNNFIQNID